VRRLTLFLCFGFLISACGGSEPAGPAAPTVASITLGQTTVSFVSLGETVTISASPRDAGGSTVSASVAWTSSDAGVASVSGGLVTATGNGSATITASSGAASAEATVVVQQVAAGVGITPADGVIKAASMLTGSVVDARGNAIAGGSMEWTSLTPGIVTVDADGGLTPMDTGVGRIQVDAGGFTAVALVRTVWNVQVLSDLFPLFEYPSGSAPRAAFSDEDQMNGDERGMILDQIWTYMASVLPNGGNANTEFFFTTWGEIWTEFTPFCSGQFIEPRSDITNWTMCTGAKTQHFFTVENEPSDRFIIMRFTARQFVLNSYNQSGNSPWFVAGYSQWLSAGDFQNGVVVVDQPRLVSRNDFAAGDTGGTLTGLDELLNMSSAVFFADPENRTPTAVKMGQSVMFFDYLDDNHSTIIPGLLAMIQANPGAGVTNAQVIQFITNTSGMTVAELETAYLAHARSL